MRHLYRVKLIHTLYDWDCEFTYEAPDARTARKWALVKLADNRWIVISARRVGAL